MNKSTRRYYYDGQTCMEEDYAADTLNDPIYDITYYGLGARGIAYIESWAWDPGEFAHVVTKKFPLYDCHENMLATLKRNGTSYTVTDGKSYDIWGSVRSGSGEPFQRYCANLGHAQDDESDLIYMKARFYEPWTGRFVTQDPAMDGLDWYVYCGNDPTNRIDPNGRYSIGSALIGFLAGLAFALLGMCFGERPTIYGLISMVGGALPGGTDLLSKTLPKWIDRILSPSVKALESAGTKAAENSHAAKAVQASAEHAGKISGALISLGIDECLMFGDDLIQPFWML